MPGTDPTCALTLCRTCDGTPESADPNESAHLRALTALAHDTAGSVNVRLVDCLDACDHANVVVVRPSRAGRARGARPVWLGWVDDDETRRQVDAWVQGGGPGLAPIPELLSILEFTPPRLARTRLAVAAG